MGRRLQPWDLPRGQRRLPEPEGVSMEGGRVVFGPDGRVRVVGPSILDSWFASRPRSDGDGPIVLVKPPVRRKA